VALRAGVVPESVDGAFHLLALAALLGVIDLDGEDGHRGVGPNDEGGHSIVGFQSKRCLWRLGETEGAFEPLVEPKHPADLVLGRVHVVVVWGGGDAPVVGGDLADGLGQVVDPGVEVVGRIQEEERRSAAAVITAIFPPIEWP